MKTQLVAQLLLHTWKCFSQMQGDVLMLGVGESRSCGCSPSCIAQYFEGFFILQNQRGRVVGESAAGLWNHRNRHTSSLCMWKSVHNCKNSDCYSLLYTCTFSSATFLIWKRSLSESNSFKINFFPKAFSVLSHRFTHFVSQYAAMNSSQDTDSSQRK